MNLHRLDLTARYERKLLARSSVFVILFVSVIGIVLFFHLWVYSVLNVPSYVMPPSGYIFEDMETSWTRFVSFREQLAFLPASMPYANAVLLNILQSVVVIFIAGHFFARNKRLGSNAALDVRPVTNAEYVFGKGLGVIYLLVMLNVLAILIAWLIHLFASSQPYSAGLYLFYFFTLILPSLLFMTGCTILVKSFVKPEILAILCLLVFLGIDIWVVGKFYHGVADFLALRVPNLFSTITGHPGISSYLLQRCIFVLAGGGGMFFAVALLKRIPEDRVSRKYHVFRGIFIVGGMFVFVACFVIPFRRVEKNRSEYATVYREYNRNPKVNTRSHDIVFRQDGSRYEATSRMVLENKESQVIDTLIFYLNPGLEVKQVAVEEKKLAFRRDHQALLVEGQRVYPGDSVLVEIRYSGTIDESVCYPEINREEYDHQDLRDLFLCPGKHFAFLDKSYVLLTPECLWYPVTIPRVNIESPFLSGGDFTRYRLSVVQPGDKSVVSQGEPERDGDTLRFLNHRDMLGIVLVSGFFVKDAYCPDDQGYEFYNARGHYPLEGVFKDIPGEMRKETFTSFFEEWSFYAYYPFNRLRVVEVPISFSSVKRPWQRCTEFSHPEVILQPERAGGWVDSRGELKRAREREPDLTLATLLRRILSYEMNRNVSLVRPLLTERWQGEADYFLTEHLMLVSSREFPAVGCMVRMLKTDFFGTLGYFLRQGQKSREMDAVNVLARKSLREGLHDADTIVEKMISILGAQLQKYILTKISWDELKTFMTDFYERYRCREVDYEIFAQELQDAFGFDILPYTRKIYDGVGVPAFVVRDEHVAGVIDDREKVMVVFDILNRGNADGIITVEGCEYDPDTRSNRVFMKNCEVKAGESKAFRILAPRYPLHLWTNFSRNLPDYYTFPSSADKVLGKESIQVIDSSFFKSPPGVILVDNDDPGFKIVDEQVAFFEWRRQKETPPVDILYGGFAYPEKWTLCVTDKAYGNELRSLYCKSTGKAIARVEWNAMVEEPGEYELFIYFPNIRLNTLEWKFADQNYLFYHGGKEEKITLFPAQAFEERKVLIGYSDGGQEELPFPSAGYNAPGVWVPAGNYKLAAGKIKLELRNQQLEKGYLMTADAVKWVKINKVAGEP